MAFGTSIGSRRRPVPVQLQQVEDVEERAGLVAPVAEQLKGSPAFLIATHHLAVDEAGPNLAMVSRPPRRE